MYKLLVVDDEELIRQGLVARINYNKFTFEKISQCEDGKKALEIISVDKPHIVITDIRMMEMDGIQLIRKSKEICPDIKFIIISGYAEFEYAEQALNMGVSGYLLKPVSDEELSRVLSKVISELNEKNTIKNINESKENLERKYNSLYIEQKINKLISITKSDTFLAEEDEVKELLKIEKDEEFVLALLNIDGENYYEHSYSYDEIVTLKYEVKGIMEQVFKGYKSVAIDNNNNKNQILLFIIGKNLEDIKYYDEIRKLYNYIIDKLDISITIGVSNSCEDISYEILRQAEEAFNHRIICGSGEIYKYFDKDKMIDYLKIKNNIRLLEKYIERCDTGNIDIFIKNIFNEDGIEDFTQEYMKVAWMEVINVLVKVVSTMKPELVSDLESTLSKIKPLDTFVNRDSITEYLYNLVITALQIEETADANCKSKVKMAIEYINEYYYEDITVNDLAYKYGVSPNYFSTIFKKEMGKTVINYITEVRIKNACDFLIYTKASIVDIGEKIGYQEPQYFFRVFKKVTGKTPLEYRKGNYNAV